MRTDMEHINYNRELKKWQMCPGIRREIEILLKRNNGYCLRDRPGKKNLSFKTRYKRFVNLGLTMQELYLLGYRVEKVSNLKEKHIGALVKFWEENGHGTGTIENKLTYLRALVAWAGREPFIRSGIYYSRDPGGYKRTGIAERDKTWSGSGVDVLAVLSRLALEDRVVAMQMELQLAFGMRVEESMLFRPRQGLDEALNRNKIKLVVGTKGGRPREVALDEVVQMDVLARASEMEVTRYGTMIPPKYTLLQWMTRYYYLVRKAGIRKSVEEGGLGVTSHGLRHEYLNQLFAKITGLPAPIKSDGEEVYDPDLLRTAMKEIVERAGHSRVSKAQAYIGAIRFTNRPRRNSVLILSTAFS